MRVNSRTDILTLSNTQAKELAGRIVSIGGVTYHFMGFEPKHPGQPPWRSGAEGKAYPCLAADGSVAAYLKFFTRPTQKRLDRTAWLIGQQMHTWLPSLAAAPVLWSDTRHGLHRAKIDFQFAAYLAKAVPGETWLERKTGIASGERVPDEFRWRCVRDLLLAPAALEQAELVHGDLSPNNVVIDLDAQPDEPALHLIDFDAFCAAAAGANRVVTVAKGGTYGTEGYCPPDLAAAAGAGDGTAAPYSDRYGRDMLLLEFLLMGSGLPADDPLVNWNREQVQRQFAAWRARTARSACRHWDTWTPRRSSSWMSPSRPASVDLAVGLGLAIPEHRVLHRVTELTRPTPAVLGYAVPQRTSTGPHRPVVKARMEDVFEVLANNRPVTPRSDLTEGEMKVGCFVAVGMAITLILAVLAGTLSPAANAPKTTLVRPSAGSRCCSLVRPVLHSLFCFLLRSDISSAANNPIQQRIDDFIDN